RPCSILSLTALTPRCTSLTLPTARSSVLDHAAPPALVHERLRRTLGFLLYRLARRALGADEQPLAAVGNHLLVELRSFRVHRLRDRKSTRLDSGHTCKSYAVFRVKKKIT